MPWVYFSRNYEFRPKKNVMILYHAGNTYLVSRACAEQALAREVAIPVQRPMRNDDATRTTNGGRPSEP